MSKSNNKTQDSIAEKTKNKKKSFLMIFLRWSTLHKLYSGIFGKSMFIISLAGPLSLIIPLGIDLGRFQLSLTGAIFIAVGFIALNIFVPQIIIDHKTHYNYSEWVLNKSNEEVFDFWGEFKHLNKYYSSTPPEYLKNCLEKMNGLLPIEQGSEILGDKKAAYNFAIVNFNILDYSNTIKRVIISVLFYFGIFFFYFPILQSVFKVLFA